MKKTVFILILISFVKLASSQNYIHFPDSNALWTEEYWPFDDMIHPWVASFHCYGLLNKDTIINSKKYHQLYRSNDTIFDESEYCGGIREDSLGHIYYNGVMTTMFGNVNMDLTNKDVLLYNFSLQVGDTIRNKYKDTISDLYNIQIGIEHLVVESIDSVYVSGNYRKRINFNSYGNSWVEGIGNTQRGLMFTNGAVTTNGPWNILVCFKQNDNWIYHSPDFSNCFPDYLGKINESNKKKNDVVVYPNPVTGISYIKFVHSVQQFEELEIYSVTGNKVKYCSIKNQPSIVINRSDYSSGLYFFKVVNRDGYSVTGKFIID